MSLSINHIILSQELKEIPVLLRKQIEIYFEDGYIDENMNGVELMESCTSERHHTTAALLCNIYDLLLVWFIVPLKTRHEF